MYFVVIMAFALVLTDELPPAWFENLIGRGATVWIAVGQIILVGLVAAVSNRLTLSRLDASEAGFDRSTSMFSFCSRVLLGLVAVGVVVLMVMTPWSLIVRSDWHIGSTLLGDLPLVGDLTILLPFFLSLVVMWAVLYRAERRIREVSLAHFGTQGEGAFDPNRNAATAALAAARGGHNSGHGGLGAYLLDKFRHQVFIIAAPMTLIVFAKHFTDMLIPGPGRGVDAVWPIFARLPWLADSVLGLASICILGISPVLLRFIWSTEPLPAGPLRDRFVATCGRIGLGYREILLWHTHGTAINAAVMGFIAPLRYILVSDALLETMDEDEIEAVFGHEAGHIRHWHLPYFILFALVSMYLAGGSILVFVPLLGNDAGLLQVIALTVLLLMWLFGFGWLSRRFERQADVYGTRCVAMDIKNCGGQCPVHGEEASAAGLCTRASSLFGRTLMKIADLNGIPRDAPSWRHGTIASRCQMLHELTEDSLLLRRFDRRLLVVKIGLIFGSLVGTIVTVWIYYPYVAAALKSLGYWPGAGE